MQSAQKQQDVDPAEVGIGAKYRDSLFGYQRIAKEIIASIEDRLEELTARHSSDAQPVTLRSPLGSWLLRGVIGLLLVAAILGGVLVWQWPRNETMRSMVARTAPQPVIDLLSDNTNRQDASPDQSAPADSSLQAASLYRATSDNNDRSNGVAPSVDQSQLVQRMARDISTLQEVIEQLRAGQDQLLRMMMRPAGLNAQARTPARAIATQQTTGLAPSPPLPPRRPTVVRAIPQ